MKQLTTEQFAELEQVTPVAIRKRIHMKTPMPAGVTLTKHGKSHVFNVSQTYFKNKPSKIRK
jgi:hypothetical protein